MHQHPRPIHSCCIRIIHRLQLAFISCSATDREQYSGFAWIPWVSGAVGAALGLVAWKLSMFLAGAVIGLFATRGFLPNLNEIAQVVIALAAGTLVHLYKEPVISLLTAIAGSYVATGSAMIMLEDIGVSEPLPVLRTHRTRHL